MTNNPQKNGLRELLRNIRFFYIGWVSHIFTMIIIAIIEPFLIDYSEYPKGLPSYSNAMVNIVFRFPLWFFGTALLTTLLILVCLKKVGFITKVYLVIINGLVVGTVSLFMIIFLPFLTYFQEIIIISSILMLIPMIIFSYLLKKLIK